MPGRPPDFLIQTDWLHPIRIVTFSDSAAGSYGPLSVDCYWIISKFSEKMGTALPLIVDGTSNAQLWPK